MTARIAVVLTRYHPFVCTSANRSIESLTRTT